MRKTLLLCLLTLSGWMGLFAQVQDWGQLERYQAANATLKKNPKAVILGSSLIDFWPNYHPEFFTKHDIVGRGISGQTSSQLLVRFRTDVLNLHPKMVLILTGSNDIALNNGYISLEHIVDNVRSMCELARLHDIEPIICSSLPISQFPWRKELQPAEDIRQLNALLRAYARQEQLRYVDFYSRMSNEQGGMSPDIAPDGVHPNAQGYTLMEEILLDQVKELRSRRHGR